MHMIVHVQYTLKVAGVIDQHIGRKRFQLLAVNACLEVLTKVFLYIIQSTWITSTAQCIGIR